MLEYKVFPVSMSLHWKKIAILVNYYRHKKLNCASNTIDEKQRTKKLHFQARLSSHSIENCFVFWKISSFLKSELNISSSSLTYKTMKSKFKEYFLSIFHEDPCRQPMEKQHGNK